MYYTFLQTNLSSQSSCTYTFIMCLRNYLCSERKETGTCNRMINLTFKWLCELLSFNTPVSSYIHATASHALQWHNGKPFNPKEVKTYLAALYYRSLTPLFHVIKVITFSSHMCPYSMYFDEIKKNVTPLGDI